MTGVARAVMLADNSRASALLGVYLARGGKREEARDPESVAEPGEGSLRISHLVGGRARCVG